ncbi:cysteine desulfurase family protein [Terrihabitans sp. B22-R8]|uniref:cysteine desulfurase family protein n=1 Tax=Terrihabitans sp. B22-R8 TaxID=3425128 RepID=UPI00403C1A84
MSAIYLDYNGTTPVAPEVLEAMLPFLTTEFGNPSSGHARGRTAHAVIERAREQVAGLIGAEPDEIVFTGSGTEASNLAIRGIVRGRARRTVVTSDIEHPATQACCRALESEGHYVRRVRARRDGIVSAEDMSYVIGREAALVTIIHAQNEIGTLQPLAEMAPLARKAGALLHADAAQSIGKVAVNVRALGVDLLSIAGHKLYAPKGVGALYVRRGVELRPVLVGAGQERGLRPGTENVAFIAGLGAACALAGRRLEEDAAALKTHSARLLALLREKVPGIALVGDPERRLPNTLNVLFPDVSGRRLLQDCPEIEASNGSACHAGSEAPSAVLSAIGITAEKALGAVRLSLGRGTSEDDVERAAAALAGAWRRLREGQPGEAAVEV